MPLSSWPRSRAIRSRTVERQMARRPTNKSGEGHGGERRRRYPFSVSKPEDDDTTRQSHVSCITPDCGRFMRGWIIGN